MYYEDVIRALNKNEVRYVVAGGVAVVLYGFVRFTFDLDIIVELTEENIERLFDTLNTLDYRPKIPATKDQFKDEDKRREWIEKKEMKVFSLFHTKDPLKLVDILITEPIPFNEIMEKQESIKAEDIIIPILSIDHLIQLKKNVGRSQDIIDVKNLEKIKRMRKK